MNIDLIFGLDKDFPSAQSMRAKLDAAGTQAARNQLRQLAEQIDVATTAGQGMIRVEKLEVGVKGALERKGYKVTRYAPDQRDVGQRAYYTVSW